MLARLAPFRTIIVVATALLLLAGVPMSAYGRSPDPRVAYAS
jgi:hypothetical protein